MMLTVVTVLSVLFLSSLIIPSCDLCKTVLGGLGLWVIYNSFEFVAGAVHMADLICRNILTIPKFSEHVCLSVCVGIPGLPPSGLMEGAHSLFSTGPNFSLVRHCTHSVHTYTSDIRFTTGMVRLNHFSNMYMIRAIMRVYRADI
jgi:hypothetical protein